MKQKLERGTFISPQRQKVLDQIAERKHGKGGDGETPDGEEKKRTGSGKK